MSSVDFYNSNTAHRALMTKYYNMQAPIYDATHRMFLFGRDEILRDLELKPGETVIEIGCGTGRNLATIRESIGKSGELIAVDCSSAMLQRVRERVRTAGWKNVHVIDHEYGWNTVTRGEATAVLFSYSLSMIPSWGAALNCAREELGPDGRIGIVDFCSPGSGRFSQAFTEWMSWHHVDVARNYDDALDRLFQPRLRLRQRAMGAAWRYFRYVGVRIPTSQRARS
jgi:S-adenosylmethionine-diacylgycerolhomoserine-N-methlytransferase